MRTVEGKRPSSQPSALDSRGARSLRARHTGGGPKVASGAIKYHHVGMTGLLNDTQVSEALQNLPEWEQDGTRLSRTVEFASFLQAIQGVNRIAEIAENENHHPDFDVRWRKVTFHCSTHSEGGITAKDVSMAEEIDGVVDALSET